MSRASEAVLDRVYPDLSYVASAPQEIKLKPYQIAPGVTQIGMGGAVTPVLSEINFSEQLSEGYTKGPNYLLEISPNQLALPEVDVARWERFKIFYQSEELAGWAIYLNLKNPGAMYKQENLTQLPPRVAIGLYTNRSDIKKY